MAFTLVYTAEHYVIDILLGWAFAAAVILALKRYDAWRSRSSPPESSPADSAIVTEA